MPKIINKVIKILISSNVIFNFGWSLMMPFFAIFILQKISTNNVVESIKIIGIAELCFYITRSVVQIPIGRYLDNNHGEKDDFWFVVVGTFIQVLIPIGYLMSGAAWHIYGLQIIHGVAASMAFPSWSALFTRHIDKNREAMEWSIQSTFANFVVGIASGIGAIVAASFGFTWLFIFASIFTFISGILLFFIKKEISPVNQRVPRATVPY